VATQTITWDDFSGGFFVGAKDNQQPMNTWRGIDVTVAPQSGYLLRRSRYTQSISKTAAFSGTTQSGAGWPGNLTPTAHTVFEVKDPANAVNVVPAIAFCTLGGTVGTPDCNFVVVRGYSGTTTALNFPIPSGKIPTSNVLVVPTGLEANVFVAVAKPDGTLPEMCTIGTGTGTMVNFTIPQAFGTIELYGDYMVAGSVTSNRVYFSNAYPAYGDWTTAGVGGFFEVGDGSSPLALIVQRDSLWIGKRNGWWVLNGVLESADNVSLRQIAVTTGPPGVSPISASAGFPYPFRHGGLRELAAASDMGILYPNGVSAGQATLSTVFPGELGPGGRGGVLALSGIDTALVLAAPQEVMTAGGFYTGIVPACDSAVIVEHTAGRPDTTKPVPYDEFEGGAWVLKGRMWERRTPPTVTTGGAQGWARDMRALDGIPRQNLIYVTRTTDGGSEDITVWSGPLYNEYPDSAIPCQVRLAGWSSARPFRVKRMSVIVDFGALDISGAGNFPAAFVRARLSSPGSINNGIGTEVSTWQELQLQPGDGRPEDRTTAVLSFEPTDLSETLEVQPEIQFSACRIRRVSLEVVTT
jgi:hypothetical protein